MAMAMGPLLQAARRRATTTLASAIIMAAGRPCSIQEALDIARDVHFATFPSPNLAEYKEWEKDKQLRLNRTPGKP